MYTSREGIHMIKKEYKILIAEDNEDISELLRLYLTSEGYLITSVDNGLDALKKLESEAFDLLLIDIMMPGMNGYRVIEETRKKSMIPIIIISAKNQEKDKILGLNIGADDYIEKPFRPMEVIARVYSNIRRCYQINSNSEDNDTIKVGELELNLSEIVVKKNGVIIDLSPMEFKILLKLMKSPGQVFTKIQIYESVYSDYFDSNDNSVMVHISKLREKLEDDSKNPKYIKTVRGLGYKIEKK